MQNRDFKYGDLVRHFKRETLTDPGEMDYIYEVLAIATHTETKEKLVIYGALYGDRKIYARPYDMFVSEVDREKYPNIKQKYRFEKIGAF